MTGLITINDNNNYGNRLQNYATYFVLQQYDVTLNIVRKYGCEIKNFPYGKESFIRRNGRKIKNIFFAVIHPIRSHFRFKRRRNFVCFNRLIRNGEFLSYRTNLTEITKKYDYLIVGSDQVWNPSLLGNGLYINMLGFCTNPSKKYSLSSSVAINNLSSTEIDEFKFYLKDFNLISCRESAGSNFISELLDRKVTTLIDPTLMLSKEQWLSISNKPRYIKNKKFLLIYFLGEIKDDYKDAIEFYKNIYNLELIYLNDEFNRYYSVGPSEFVWLIKNCEAMLTDSYHGCIFAYLFEKPLLLFDRFSAGKNMNSRLETLIETLKIEKKNIFCKGSLAESILPVHYSKEILDKERQKFALYLDQIYREKRGKH